METEVPLSLENSLSAGLRVTLDNVFRGMADTLSLVITVDADDSLKGWKAWVIKTWCQQHEYRLVEPPVVVKAIRFVEHHPLLLHRTKTQSELYFTDRPDDVDLMLQDLKVAHERIAADFIPFMTFMNARHNEFNDLRKLAASGHGAFAVGPDALIVAYANVLTRHGCRTKVLAAPNQSSDSRPQPTVLELDPAGVVMGTGFQFRTCTSRRKFNNLIERLRGW